MKNIFKAKLVCLLFGVFLFLPINSFAATIDFETLPDLANVDEFYSAQGLHFSNAISLTAGISLNEFDFPPHSGTNVISDDFGSMSIAFDTPVESLWGYFTYIAPLSLAFYDSSDVLITTALSTFFDNTVFSGNSPNELLGLNYVAGISRVVIEGDPFGGSFVLDDLSYEPAGATPVPEPATLLLLSIGLIALLNKKRKLNVQF